MSLRDTLNQDAVTTLRMLDAVVVGPQQTVEEAIALMHQHRAGCLVITEHGKPVGIFTERDFLTKVLAAARGLKTPLAKVMTSPTQVIEEGCSVVDVMRRMQQGGYRNMPVVDAGGMLRGVVSVKKIVEYLVEHFPATVFNLPPEPGQQQLAREGA